LKFIKDTLLIFSTKIIIIILGLVIAIIIAKVLGPSGKGSYTLIILIPTLLLILGNLGISTSNVYLGGKKKYNWVDITSNSLISALGLGIILTIAFLIYFLNFPPSFLKDIDPQCILLATLVLPFSFLTMYFNHILLAQNRIKEYNLVRLSQSSILVILIVFFLLALNGGVFGAILAWACATLVSAILSILLLRKTTRITWFFYPALFRDSIKFGIKAYLGNIIQLLNYRLDMFLIVFFMNISFVGYYSVAVVLAETLWYFPATVGTVIFVRTSGLNTEEANKSTPRICRNTFFVTILAALVLFALSRYIIILFFGSVFLLALKPLWILLPGVIALSICKVLSNEITGRGKPMINTIASGVSLAMNVPLNLLLIPRMGIVGAAWASSISYTITTIVVLIAFMKISKNSLFDTIIIKPQDLKIYTDMLAKIGNRFQSAIVNFRLRQ